MAQHRAPPGVWRLLGPATVGWIAAATLIVMPGTARWAALGSAIVGTVITVLALRSQRARTLLEATALTCAVIVLLGVRIDAGEHVRLAPEFGSGSESRFTMSCSGTLTGYPKQRALPTAEVRWLHAECESARGEVPVLLWLSDHPDPTGWAPGMRVQAQGTATRLEPASNAGFSLSVSHIEVAEPVGFRERLGALAAQLRTSLREHTERVPRAELVPGFAVGDTSLVDERLERAMLESSLTHLTAVSGANCALITAAILATAGRFGAERRLKIVLATIALGGFVVLVGPDASVQRAAVMAVVVLVSGFGGKRAVALPGLGAAMLLLMLIDPWQSLQAGFALSVAATGGILLLAPAIRNALARVPYLPQWIALPVALAVSAQITCGPLLLLLRPGLPAAGVLANVLAAPAAPIGTGFGVLALLLLPFGVVGEFLGRAALWIASFAARWVAATAEVTSNLPFSTLAWPEGWPGALLLAGVQAAAVLGWALMRGHISIPGMRHIPRQAWGPRRIQSRALRTTVAVIIGSAAGIFVAVTIAMPIAGRAQVPGNWSVVACDVGQGDAILVRNPEHTHDVMLIDTGEDEQKLATCLDRFGVTRIAFLVLTHDDQDHVGALHAVADRVDAALIAPDTKEQVDGRAVRQQLETAEIPYTVGARGVAGGSDALSWRVLAPQVERTPDNANAASLVLRVHAGSMTLLALGDTGEDEHGRLLSHGDELGSNVVKVAHHGSGDQDPELLAATAAQFGIISVGADNRYGHPAAGSLEALEQAGTHVLRTDEHGSIAISIEGGQLRPWVERTEPANVE